jgi:hypothetical protein
MSLMLSLGGFAVARRAQAHKALQRGRTAADVDLFILVNLKQW